jgi:hypothetical protein
MATSSRQSALFGVNDWKTIYQTFREADFRSYDYETLRKSFIDYLRVYYPETFNDYTESSEFIALLDVIAFMGQGLAFRDDLNTRENFIDTAERRDSVIKLANLISYTPKRNLTSEGYLKVVNIRTTQNITDLNGINLSNIPILWNDPANPFWLEQFNTIINACIIDSQRIGKPGNVSDILGVTTSEYSISIPPNSLPIVPFTSTVNGINMNFELVSVTSVDVNGLKELPPAPTGRFNLLYRNDKLGFGSPNTGYFFYFKQGTLQNVDFNIQQQISNQVIDINVQGINNTDTWLYQLNTDNNPTLIWKQVENVYADAYLQTENSDRNIFSVYSRFNDQVSYIFGDGVFSKIPVGQFRAYVRSSNGLTYTIDQSEMQGISVSFTYINRVGRQETLTVGLELQTPVSNSQQREPLVEIKQRAPTRYYTQNRMVNGEDYNNFPYTLYSSIIKSKAINRSSIGVSKNLDLLDPTGKYSSTTSFANDGAIYLEDNDGSVIFTITNTEDIIKFLSGTLTSIFSSNRVLQYYSIFYPNYSLESNVSTEVVYWQNSTVDTNTNSGYFYNVNMFEIPIAAGAFTVGNMQYITKDAVIKFVAPDNYYFDANKRLVQGIPGPSDYTYFWTTILSVVGDGYNGGEGSFSNGQGPITVNGFVPTGAILDTVIPAFDNSLSNTIIQECIIAIDLQQNFSLLFDNSLNISQERWSLGAYNDTNYFVNFLSLGNNRYLVSYRSLAYFFGSVQDIRFTFEQDKLVYDPFSGKILQDSVTILEINTQPNSKYPLPYNVPLNIVGQTIQSDGYVDDFEVEVSLTDINNQTLLLNPNFFTEITGYNPYGSNIGIYVFFELLQDAVNLSRYQILPTTDVVFIYPTKAQIEVVKYEYPEQQLYYAYDENLFYKSVQDQTKTTVSYILVQQPLNYYITKTGRQGLQFQYIHNSNNTTRIDPATTNIIDLYVVTQSYYTAYTNYITDSSDTVLEPNKPTINELSELYSQVNDYKMISDSLVINSVEFLPLFGPKAPTLLQATLKVVRAQNTNASDSEIKSAILSSMDNYFNINNWNFGNTFYFSELSAYLHNEVGELVSSIILVPNDPILEFGDLYEIKCAPYEIFVNAATANDIVIIAGITPATLSNG